MNFSATTLNAETVRAVIDQKRKELREKEEKQEAAAKAEQERLRQEFAEREVKPQALELIASLIGKAVERSEREVMVMRFPSSWLPDHGRAINNKDKNWPDKLDGFARRAYEYYEKELRPRGFEIRAMILEWPDGMPGDVGLFLTW
jgi:hypothetical protein